MNTAKTRGRGRPSSPASTVAIYVRLPKELRAWLREQALREERQPSTIIARLLREYRAKGESK